MWRTSVGRYVHVTSVGRYVHVTSVGGYVHVMYVCRAIRSCDVRLSGDTFMWRTSVGRYVDVWRYVHVWCCMLLFAFQFSLCVTRTRVMIPNVSWNYVPLSSFPLCDSNLSRAGSLIWPPYYWLNPQRQGTVYIFPEWELRINLPTITLLCGTHIK